MMEDAGDPDDVALHIIEDAMPAMMQAVDGRLDFRVESAGPGMTPQQIERPLEAAHIFGADILAKGFDAVVEDRGDIRVGRLAKADFSHAARR